MEEGMVSVTITRKCPMAFLHRQHLSIFQRLCADFRSCWGNSKAILCAQPPMSLASLQNGPAQSRQIATFGAGQPASAGGSHCSQGHQALVRRVGRQALDAVTHAFLLSLSSDLQRTGAGFPPACRPFPGSKESTVESSRALGMVRSLS